MLDRVREKIPKWNMLRSLGNNKFVRGAFVWFYVVPLAIKIIQLVSDKLNDEGLATEVAGLLPFSWQIFYFSAAWFAIGVAIFLVGCPTIIKVERSFASFCERRGSSADLVDYLLNLRPFLARKARKDRYRQLVRDFMFQFTADPTEIWGRLEDEGDLSQVVSAARILVIPQGNFRDAFSVIWREADTKNATARIVCGLCFAFGVLGFVVVSLENFFVVLDYVADQS